MTDNSYQLMAKQFVDMWQKQLADMLVDENFVANVVDTMHQTGGFPNDPSHHTNAASAHSTVSSDAANAALAQLERRLASAEGRIAELEREMAELRRRLDEH
ncbi:MAG: hypothetical protein MK052_06650 [Alphaproteobacteria bacterium]|nr:hypothetical protein [Alphaproteobacteria bacterium]